MSKNKNRPAFTDLFERDNLLKTKGLVFPIPFLTIQLIF